MLAALEFGNGSVTDLDFTMSLSKVYDATPESSTMLIGAGLGSQVDPTLTVAEKQRFTIHEMSPEWGSSGDYTKVYFVRLWQITLLTIFVCSVMCLLILNVIMPHEKFS